MTSADALMITVLVVASGGVGALVMYAPGAAALSVAGVVGVYFCVSAGLFGVGAILVGVLPWLVVFDRELPPLLKTFWAGAAAAVILLLAVPRKHDSATERLGWAIGCMAVPVTISLVLEGTGQQIIQAAKYLIFPTLVVAVVLGTDRVSLRRLAKIGLFSSGAALAVHLAIAAAGLGKVGTKYHSGELLGFASEHELSLFAVSVAAGAAGTGVSGRLRPLVLGLAVIAAFATGVRTGVVALFALGVVLLVRTRLNIRTVALITLAFAALLVSGAWNVVAERVATRSRRASSGASLPLEADGVRSG